ncbi:MAG TPA: alkaline phosphatase family protein, partial [Candidatus Baltobacteraceae bacterium]|nr:alkaline phosphatase family protein [Candidatus Baltobacteraceae bacterium]
MSASYLARLATAALVSICLAACNAGRSLPPSGAGVSADVRGGDGSVRKYIKHVVIVVQENRTFDNLFHGFAGADYATSGFMHDGTKVQLHPVKFGPLEVANDWPSAMSSWNHGAMNG